MSKEETEAFNAMELYKDTQYGQVKIFIELLLNLIKKQDKAIYKMASRLTTEYHSKEDVINYFMEE